MAKVGQATKIVDVKLERNEGPVMILGKGLRRTGRDPDGWSARQGSGVLHLGDLFGPIRDRIDHGIEVY